MPPFSSEYRCHAQSNQKHTNHEAKELHPPLWIALDAPHRFILDVVEPGAIRLRREGFSRRKGPPPLDQHCREGGAKNKSPSASFKPHRRPSDAVDQREYVTDSIGAVGVRGEGVGGGARYGEMMGHGPLNLILSGSIDVDSSCTRHMIFIEIFQRLTRTPG
jgi:hypothetical protein